MNKKQIACYLELFKVIQRSEMLDDKQKEELDIFLANLKGKYDKHRKKNKRLIDYVERLKEELKCAKEDNLYQLRKNKDLQNRIDKAIEYLKNENIRIIDISKEIPELCEIELLEILKDSDVDE